MLPRTLVLLWILAGSLSLPDKSEPCRGSGLPAACDFVFRNVCFEFVDESKTWSQARDSCENRGGKLLEVMSSPVKGFMKNVTRGNKNIFTWWLGEQVQGDSALLNDVAPNNSCTYITLKPLLLILTSDCSQSRGSVCTHGLQPSSQNPVVLSSHPTRCRLRRSLQDMALSVTNISALLHSADSELYVMETTPGEPTNDDRDQFIQYLQAGIGTLTPAFAVQNSDIMSHIINCSTGIFLLSETKCDILTNPNPTNLFEEIFEIFRLVSILIGKQNNQTLIMKLRTGTLYQRTYSPSNIANSVLGSEADGDFVVFPSYSALQAQLGVSGQIYAQMASFSDNPHPSDDNITGTVCSLLLTDGVNDIRLSNLSEMIEIFLPRPDAPDVINTTVTLTKQTKALTSFNVSDPNMTLFFGAEPSVNVSLVVALSYGSPPPDSQTPNLSTVLTAGEGYCWMITPEMIQHRAGLWYVDTRLSNSSLQPDVTLKITSFMTKCLYWNVDTETWRTDGCMAGNKSTSKLTHCLCNHLTLFGSSFLVMPNYVDISQTAQLFATVSQNYVVLALLCSFFGLYLLTLMWACYADRRAHLKRKITLLEDNHPGALYNYLIHIQTGHRRNAGTSANVTVRLTGSGGESDTHTLTDPDKPVFERGAADMFLLATPYPLGEVSNLRMQHDNSGGHPSWYVNKVIVQDLQTRHVWHFFCNCWLSADRGDNMTKKTFNVAKNNEIASFRNIFQTRTSTGFRDEHIWMSIVNPPSRSPFTRAQRVSCCMSLLLCTMAINIAFWNVPLDPNAPVIFQIGSLQMTWQEFMVGVECGLLMFPINILIITIFRSIRARIVSKPQEVDSLALRCTGINLPAILKETEVIISSVSRSPRNKLSEINRLETGTDLYYALDRLHEFVQLMQGESESDHHWVYCSKFLFAGLCHLLMCLEKLDEKHFPYPQEYQQVLNITNLLVRKTEMVLSSHLTCCPTPVKRTKKKVTGGFWLPWWFVFVGWFLLLSISAVSTYFTLLYSFQYGKDKSIKWVLSLGLSLFQSIFVLQPLKVIGVAVVFALLLKPVAVEETEEVEQALLEQQAKCRRYSGRQTL